MIYLDKSRHFIIVIIILFIIVLISVPTKCDNLCAITELNMAVSKSCETLQQNLLASDLLFAGHLAYLRK